MKIKFDQSNPRLFGEMLKELRTEHGFSQTTVAEQLGIDRTTYTKYELGRMPDVSTVAKIASLYGISAESIFSVFFFNKNDGFSRVAELGSDDSEDCLYVLTKEEQLIVDLYRKSLRKSKILDTIQDFGFSEESEEENNG